MNCCTTADEVLVTAFELLIYRHRSPQIMLEEPAKAEIACDTDGMREFRGYMGYDHLAIIEIGGRSYALAKGKACGAHPALPFAGDLIAVRIPDAVTADDLHRFLRRAIRQSSYFRHSLVFALSDGRLVIAERSAYAEKIKEALKNSGYRPERYDDELTMAVVEAIEEVLLQ